MRINVKMSKIVDNDKFHAQLSYIISGSGNKLLYREMNLYDSQLLTL